MNKADTPITWSFHNRFALALSAICGKMPPDNLVTDWLSEDGSNGLQDWVGNNLPKSIEWSQCIAILDAADTIASQPEEGQPERFDYNEI